MTTAFVQGKSGDGSGTSLALAFTSNNTAGNFLCVVGTTDTVGATWAISDTQSNTYSLVGSAYNSNSPSTAGIAMWYAPNCKGGANTVTVNPGVAFVGIGMGEYSGVKTSSPLDGSLSGTASEASSTTITGPSFTPTAGDLLCAGITADGAQQLISAASPWLDGASSTDHVMNDSNQINSAVDQEYTANAPASSTAAKWTQATAQTAVLIYAAFLAAGAAPVTPRLRTLLGVGT